MYFFTEDHKNKNICSFNNNIVYICIKHYKIFICRHLCKMELKCAVQSYDWGKRGINSIVADLKKSANPDFVIDEQKPYAELWMGTHENGPSYLKNTGVSLHKHIQGNIKLNNGKQELQESDSSLPFLFKVLSINKALSIQVHPDKVICFCIKFFILRIKRDGIIIKF